MGGGYHIAQANVAHIWAAQVNNIRTWMSRPGAVRWFESFGDHVHSEFRDLVASLQRPSD